MPQSKSFDPNQHIAKALVALDKQIAELQSKRAQLAAIVGGKAPKASKAAGEKPKRAMSEAARKKISDAQKKRWRDQKKASK